MKYLSVLALLSTSLFSDETVYISNAFNSANSVTAIDANTGFVFNAAIPGFLSPRFIAITPDGTKAYVQNSSAGGLAVLNVLTNTLKTTIPMNITGNPNNIIAIHPNGTRLYAADGTNLNVVDTTQDIVIAQVPLVGSPINCVIHPNGTLLYVTDDSVNALYIYSTSTLTLVDTISFSGQLSTPLISTISQDGNWLIVTDATGTPPNTAIVNTNTYAITYITNGTTGANSSDAVFAPNGATAYIYSPDIGTIIPVSIPLSGNGTPVAQQSVQVTAATGGTSTYICISPDGTRLYVTGSTSGIIGVLNLQTSPPTVLTPITAAYNSFDAALTADGTQLWVSSNSGASAMYYINLTTNTLTTGHFNNPRYVAITPVIKTSGTIATQSGFLTQSDNSTPLNIYYSGYNFSPASFAQTVSFNVYSDPGYTQFVGNYPATLTGPGSLFASATINLHNLPNQTTSFYVQHVDKHGFTRNIGPVTITP